LLILLIGEALAPVDARRRIHLVLDADRLLARNAQAGQHLNDKPDYQESDITWLPVIPNPGKILCVGLNYQDHVVETGRDNTEQPAIFIRVPESQVGHKQPIVRPKESKNLDFEAEIAVVTGDVALGSTPEQALEGVRLLMLVNDVSLRHLIPAELAKGLGFFQSKPATAFGPVAVTPDELGDAWAGGRVHLTLQSAWNGRKVGMCDAGPEMSFHFGQLIAHLCKTRNARAGTIVGSGTVSNQDWSRGYSCIAEKRAIETIELA